MRWQLLIWVLLALPLAVGCRHVCEPEYRLYRVIDGDTLEIVDAGGIRTRVRLRSVDAPEMDEPGGPEAKAALKAQLGTGRLRVTPYARDRYGRLIADVVRYDPQSHCSKANR